ncbi:MAG: HAD-IIIC family phosphatase [Paludibacter sp.]|jgi:FkbH-like protein|nr:HAD-IIIC family phosphatase [Paludibacter sp.]
MKSSIALLSNITIDPLKSALQQVGFGEVYVAGYNQWQYELLNPASEVISHPYDYLLLYLHPDELAPEFELSEITCAIDHFLQQQPTTIVLLCDLCGRPLYTTTYAGDAHSIENELNRSLHTYAGSHPRVTIVQLSRIVNLHGYTTLFDEKYWYLGRMKFSHAAYTLLAQEVLYFTRAIEGKTSKVLVLDLDNTLWGGILGEEGWQHITLSNEGKGLIYKEFQRQITSLKQTGVILSLCSKNNEAEVREAFEKHPDCILKWDDFVAPRVNWLPKDQNLISIGRELNVGIDSLVFIDDSKIERELVRTSLPEVKVPEFPADSTKLSHWFIEKVVYPYFPRIHFTKEDAEKTQQYQRKKERDEVRSQFSYNEFIQQLNMEVVVQEATNDTLKRIAQLTQKTNQFNLSLKRYTEAEIATMFASKQWKLYTCTYHDKFGDEGIVGAVLVQFKLDTAHIDNFLLSCRALGRTVEFSILEQIKQKLQKSGVKHITASYCPGERNIPARSFYTDCGFTSLSDNEFEKQL